SVPPPPARSSLPPRAASALGAGVGAASANEAFGELSDGPAAPPSATPGIARRKRRFSGLRLVGLLFRIATPIVVLAIIVGSVVSVSSEVGDSVDDVRRAISTGVGGITTPATTGEGPAAAAPVGLGKGSLLKAGNFAKALQILRAEGSRARSVRVAPERLDATLVTASGFIRQVQVTWQGERKRSSQTGPGFTQAGTFPIAGLDIRAPARLARSAAGRAKRSASSVDSLVAISLGPEQQGWTVILKDGGGQYLADPRGRITRRIT
ncbi:MAG: hypothetical protein JWP18_389, partial [Solirubrobacterales bacterium]|nr:hypothetical protein [Solirubrobacterales bacterium]